METLSALHVNPWTEDDTSFGTIKRFLRLAANTGHLRPETSENLDNLARRYPSIRLMRLLKEIEETKKEIHKVGVSIQQRLQERETHDILHPQSLAKKVDVINGINTNLQDVLSHKSSLISRLQCPYVGDFIRIEASHKRYASELFTQLAPVLSELASNLENIEWATNSENISRHHWVRYLFLFSKNFLIFTKFIG
ncbi:hypothetical protein CAPTEDRAFT_135097 [Capitella teleta]|uniref:Uncharacterized protein n=1 Tax=Capitella teleta TaxID=283909 RepID=R7UBJ8_CAPTE|nr:hypothetical protein CAPTEDRAFT_135097 [Capitella teleta]|eukprot:ELU03456.1 hypothetical protein CAPTEDRAFT_135097 [Capitella teleta]